ncbi:hypothetical protein [Bradyrhizobium uaiense]|uniref:Uncharacterized protein n=1 Tax=Bradyrhizobium uaiense TaxID=2594946 RepID=A0A6P1BPN2_9BRAD|nr:hypothetical protein [Bradyrhizobium uaiense]NEU99620.1 hypothetical protein [Bradyrhizobium uaiense]
MLLLRLPNSAKSKIDAAKIPTQVQFEEWAPNFAWPAGGWRRYQAGMSQLFCSCCCWSRPTLDDADDRYVDDHYQHDGDAVEQHAHSADDQLIIGYLALWPRPDWRSIQSGLSRTTSRSGWSADPRESCRRTTIESLVFDHQKRDICFTVPFCASVTGN